MIQEFPPDYELLAFFEAEPTVLDAEAPWIYNTLEFTTTRDGIEVVCRFVPSYGKLTTRLAVGGTELAKFELRDVESFRLVIEAGREALVATFPQSLRLDRFALPAKATCLGRMGQPASGPVVKIFIPGDCRVEAFCRDPATDVLPQFLPASMLAITPFAPGLVRQREFRSRDADERRQPVAVVPLVARDKEAGLCPLVGRHLVDLADVRLARLGRLDEELVVADQGRELAVTVDRILAEHLPRRDRACRRHLLDNQRHRARL